MSLFSYTNRQKKTYYVRAVTTKTGKTRYYLTQNPEAEDLITEVPEDYEVVEYPYNGKVVIRKKVPVHTTSEEQAVVRNAMEAYSPVKDFIVTAERGGIAVSISQFSDALNQLYLSKEEARKHFGDGVHLWKKYDWTMTFELLNKKTRRFQVIRRAFAKQDAVPIDEGTDLKALAKQYCYYVGQESLLKLRMPGEDS